MTMSALFCLDFTHACWVGFSLLELHVDGSEVDGRPAAEWIRVMLYIRL